MATLEQSFDTLADPDTVVGVAAIGGGYLATSIVQSVVEGSFGQDLPNELYAVAGGAAFYGPAMGTVPEAKMMGHGSVLFGIDALAQRFGLKSEITRLATGGN